MMTGLSRIGFLTSLARVVAGGPVGHVGSAVRLAAPAVALSACAGSPVDSPADRINKLDAGGVVSLSMNGEAFDLNFTPTGDGHNYVTSQPILIAGVSAGFQPGLDKTVVKVTLSVDNSGLLAAPVNLDPALACNPAAVDVTPDSCSPPPPPAPEDGGSADVDGGTPAPSDAGTGEQCYPYANDKENARPLSLTGYAIINLITGARTEVPANKPLGNDPTCTDHQACEIEVPLADYIDQKLGVRISVEALFGLPYPVPGHQYSASARATVSATTLEQ